MFESTRLGAETQVGWQVRYVPGEDEDLRATFFGGTRDPRLVLLSTGIYTVARVEVHSWHTKLWLEGLGGELGPFNSTHFERA